MCIRDSAEAQSKDVGVIATENGWNLYVCGNGGMKPRHTDLLAQGLDKETLIKYIDRFLLFYVKTADRLQRTSVWMDNLEGGLDYLKQVVIEDSLGMAEEFERQMEAVVESYQCEWKTTIESPDKLKQSSQTSPMPSLSLSLVGKFKSEVAFFESICCEDWKSTKGEKGKAARSIITTARTT